MSSATVIAMRERFSLGVAWSGLLACRRQVVSTTLVNHSKISEQAFGHLCLRLPKSYRALINAYRRLPWFSSSLGYRWRLNTYLSFPRHCASTYEADETTKKRYPMIGSVIKCIATRLVMTRIHLISFHYTNIGSNARIADRIQLDHHITWEHWARAS